MRILDKLVDMRWHLENIFWNDSFSSLSLTHMRCHKVERETLSLSLHFVSSHMNLL